MSYFSFVPQTQNLFGFEHPTIIPQERGTLRRRCNDDEGNHLCGLGRLSMPRLRSVQVGLQRIRLSGVKVSIDRLLEPTDNKTVD